MKMATTQDKGTALVTGASSGIGAIYADRLAKRGYDLILVARNNARLATLSRRLRNETGRSVEAFAAKGLRIQTVLPGATATEFWDIAGKPVHQLPGQIVMSADDMVDAALAGLDLGEAVTIPSLPSQAEWDRFDEARRTMSGKLS